MRYPTHNSLFFNFNLPSPTVFPLPVSLQGQQVMMACAERALKKGCFKPDMDAQNVLCDDFPATTPFSVDEFFVDELLDFSNGGMDREEDDDNNKGLVASVSPQQEEEEEGRTDISDPHCKDDTCSSLPPIELSVPPDDLADLEWLSNFVEDSFTDNHHHHHPSQSLPHKTTILSEKPLFGPENLPKPKLAPAKARSKRSRAGCHAWSSHSLSGDSSSSSTSSTSSSPTSAWLLNFESAMAPAARRKRIKAADDTVPPRRCTHCGVQKTPQWRTGPMGPKTLCNACGVRFKSGRLLPEYRPACSPTFSTELHSNSHRKVLEMRRGKECVGGPDHEPGRVLAVRNV